MSPVLDHGGQRPCAHPDKDLNEQVAAVLRHAVDAHRDELQVYESLRNLNEVIGTQYGDRVLYELIQNAHDAHRARRPRAHSREACRSCGERRYPLRRQRRSGFRRRDVQAIKNLATTAKAIGEGIGNKGLGSEASRH